MRLIVSSITFRRSQEAYHKTAIGEQESGMQCVQVVAQFGGGILASTLFPPKDLPATVEAAMGKLPHHSTPCDQTLT